MEEKVTRDTLQKYRRVESAVHEAITSGDSERLRRALFHLWARGSVALLCDMAEALGCEPALAAFEASPDMEAGKDIETIDALDTERLTPSRMRHAALV